MADFISINRKYHNAYSINSDYNADWCFKEKKSFFFWYTSESELTFSKVICYFHISFKKRLKISPVELVLMFKGIHFTGTLDTLTEYKNPWFFRLELRINKIHSISIFCSTLDPNGPEAPSETSSVYSKPESFGVKSANTYHKTSDSNSQEYICGAEIWIR